MQISGKIAGCDTIFPDSLTQKERCDKDGEFLQKQQASDVNKQSKLSDLIEKLKKAGENEEKIEIAKWILLETDIITSGNALTPFDDEIRASEQNYLKKFLEYKFDLGTSVYKCIDCDVSILCVVMYVLMLSPKLQLTDIENQSSCKRKYEIKKTTYGHIKGDTLTSALTVIKRYLGSLWKKINISEQLKEESEYKKFHGLFSKVSSKGISCAPLDSKSWESYCYENSDVVWEAMDEEAKTFLKNYNMFGNYMCIPGESFGRQSFNTARSNGGKWDTADTLLAKIYGWYRSSGDDSYLEAIFTVKEKELAEETEKWLTEFFDDWDDFIKKNALQPFDDEDCVPISLKTGKAINTSDFKTYYAMPENYEEFLTFFREVSERIAQRNECILSFLLKSAGSA